MAKSNLCLELSAAIDICRGMHTRAHISAVGLNCTWGATSDHVLETIQFTNLREAYNGRLLVE